jgi:hypothetical protein
MRILRSLFNFLGREMSEKVIKEVILNDGKKYYIGANCAKIEEYQENGMHCDIPFIRVLGYGSNIICEAPKTSCIVYY